MKTSIVIGASSGPEAIAELADSGDQLLNLAGLLDPVAPRPVFWPTEIETIAARIAAPISSEHEKAGGPNV